MNKERYNIFLLLLEEIENDYGFGPNEDISDYTKIDEYISNFINYSKERLMYESFCKLYENESKSILERLNEI